MNQLTLSLMQPALPPEDLSRPTRCSPTSLLPSSMNRSRKSSSLSPGSPTPRTTGRAVSRLSGEPSLVVPSSPTTASPAMLMVTACWETCLPPRRDALLSVDLLPNALPASAAPEWRSAWTRTPSLLATTANDLLCLLKFYLLILLYPIHSLQSIVSIYST